MTKLPLIEDLLAWHSVRYSTVSTKTHTSVFFPLARAALRSLSRLSGGLLLKVSNTLKYFVVLRLLYSTLILYCSMDLFCSFLLRPVREVGVAWSSGRNLTNGTSLFWVPT